MDCNYCPVCSKHFHNDSQSSLYCSETCRKADALACCVFHDCQHPDVSEVHDHLTFCHHHRPAIRIPLLPVAPLSVKPRQQKQQQEQAQAQDDWMVFFQSQFHQHHQHRQHYRSQVSRRDTSTSSYGSSLASNTAATAPNHCHSAASSNNQKGNSLSSSHHHMSRCSALNSPTAFSTPLHHSQPPLRQGMAVMEAAALPSGSFPSTSATAANTALSFLQEPHHAHQNLVPGKMATADRTSSWLASTLMATGEACYNDHQQSKQLSSLPSSRWLNLGLTGDLSHHHRRMWLRREDVTLQADSGNNLLACETAMFSQPPPPAVQSNIVETPMTMGATMKSPAASALIHHQSHTQAPLPTETAVMCETPCVFRKNKVLPPPTLSPILPPVISDPASLARETKGDSNSLSDWSTLESSWSSWWGHTSSNDSTDCNGWPKMDKYFFPDHCCRTSNCHSKAKAKAAIATIKGSGEGCSQACRLDEEEDTTPTLPSLPRSVKERRRSFGSELPPPIKLCHHMRDNGNGVGASGHLSALSDSIWGVGWHQVQPLPPCFLTCMQQDKAATAGSGTKANTHSQKASSGCKGGCKGGHTAVVSGRRANVSSKKGDKNVKAASAETSTTKTLLTATMCRLPRSLHFID